MHFRILAGKLELEAGSHIYHRELATGLAMRGHKVSIVATGDGPPLCDNVEVTVLQQRRYDQWPFVWRYAAHLQYKNLSRQLARARLSRPDIVIGGEHLLLRPHRQRFPGVPWIYLPHSLVVKDEIESYRMAEQLTKNTLRLYAGIQRWALLDCQYTLRFSQLACRALRCEYKLRKEPRFWINPAGIHIPKETAAKDGSPPCRILVAGRLVPTKRVDFAMEVLARQKNAWRLDVVGDGSQRADLEARARELNVSKHVRFHGHQSNLASWYERADLLLFPSELESLGLVVLEAMSHGVPCVAFSSQSGVSRNVNDELIEHRRTGWLATSEDEFRACVTEAIENAPLRRRIGQAAREVIARRNSWDAHLANFERVASELVRSTTNSAAH